MNLINASFVSNNLTIFITLGKYQYAGKRNSNHGWEWWKTQIKTLIKIAYEYSMNFPLLLIIVDNMSDTKENILLQ